MRQRVVTALLLAIPALLALALRTPWPLAALGLVAAAIGGSEVDRLLGSTMNLARIFAPLAFAGFGYLRLAFPYSSTYASVVTISGAAATALGVVCAYYADRRHSLSEPVIGFAGLWVAAPLVSILMLHRAAPGVGVWCLSPALMALVPVWAGDIAAIFAGKAFGKHPLAPKISPKKTVEGGIANLLAAVLAAWILGRLLGLPEIRSLLAGLAVGVFGQAGDLFESGLKRRAGVKDSGTLLPGHGGVLDRIDSSLFAAPLVAIALLC